MSDIQECRIGRFYARDVKDVKTKFNVWDVEVVFETHIKWRRKDVKCICRVYRFYTRR